MSERIADSPPVGTNSPAAVTMPYEGQLPESVLRNIWRQTQERPRQWTNSEMVSVMRHVMCLRRHIVLQHAKGFEAFEVDGVLASRKHPLGSDLFPDFEHDPSYEKPIEDWRLP